MTATDSRCPACGELLDVGAVGCRFCGEGLPEPDEGVFASELFDELGEWSQIKHEILEKYAHAYTTIIKRQPSIRKVLYIDAFAGTGYGVSKDTGEQLHGSAIRAVDVTPPFDELHFVEQDDAKADVLEFAVGSDSRVTVHRGDGIAVTSALLPRTRWEDYHRALCLLDPYDLSVPWSLVQTIGAMRSVEIFYNFMIMDANRNVLWKDPTKVLKNSANATVYYLYFASANKTGADIVDSIFSKYRR